MTIMSDRLTVTLVSKRDVDITIVTTCNDYSVKEMLTVTIASVNKRG